MTNFKKPLLTGLMVFFTFLVNAQHNILGRITSSDHLPAANVNVHLEETNKTIISDEDGRFTFFDLKKGVYHVTVSYTGLVTKKQEVNLIDHNKAELYFALEENTNELQAVIVNAKRGLNQLPVSAGKIAIDPMDLPQSITVIDRQVIQNQQAQRLSDVIKNVNGVYLGTTRGSTQESFYARGYSFSSGNLFKNGSRVNSGTMPEMSSLEKVEVLKGSAAILYGNVAPGGIINMVTRQPKFNKGGEVSLRTGSFGLVKPSIDIYGPANKNVAFRLNGTYEKSNSFRDVVQTEKFYINPSALIKLGNKTSLLFQGDYLDHDFTPDFGIGSLNNTTIAKVDRSHFVGTPWQFNKVKQLTASASLKHQFNDKWSLNTVAGYQLYNRNYYSIERVQADINGDWRRPLNRLQSEENYYSGNIDLNGKFKTGTINHTLLTGIDADRYYTVSYAYDNPNFYDTINILDDTKFTRRSDIPDAKKISRLVSPINRFGAYIQDLVSFSEKFKLLAGIRWSRQASLATTTTYLAMDSVVNGHSAEAAAFSPRLGLVYRPIKTTSLFASYANSFSLNSGTDVNGNAIEPSIIDQFEVGVKNDFLRGRLSANITAYKIINNNLALTAPFLADGITQNNNTAIKELAGQTVSNGIEVDIIGKPFPGFDLIAGYSCNDMHYTKTGNATGNYIEGERLVNTPAHTGNINILYRFQAKALKGLHFNAGAFYTGDRNAGWNNKHGQSQNYSRLIAVNGFTTLDFSAGYAWKNLSILAKMSNVFNVYNYYVHENYSINPIAPRAFTGTLTYKF